MTWSTYLQNLFVVGTLASSAREAHVREDQQQKTAGLYIYA